MNKFVKMLGAAIIATGSMFSNVANAQIHIQKNNTDPQTGLNSSDFVYFVTHLIDAGSIIGKPYIYMVNGTNEDLVVNCDRWQLVGPNTYIANAPRLLNHWSVTLVPTEGFDHYCNEGVVAQSASGGIYTGKLLSPDKTFSNGTFVTFIMP